MSNDDDTKTNDKKENEELLHLNSADRIKLIGKISECSTQKLLDAHLDICGIESLRPFLLGTFLKSIPLTSESSDNEHINPPPLPSKSINPIQILKNIADTKQSANNQSIKSIAHILNKTNSKKRSKQKSIRNFAHSKVKKVKLPNLLHSTNQPLPSRTTSAHQIGATQTSQPHKLSNHNNAHSNNNCTKTKQQIPAPIIKSKQAMECNLNIQIKVKYLNRHSVEKYFKISDECSNDLGIFDEELPDDLYCKIFGCLDFESFMQLKLVNRAWFDFIASNPQSCGHFVCPLPMNENMQFCAFQFVKKVKIFWRQDKNRYDRWSDFNRALTECLKANMQNIQDFEIRFHDFSFYSFSKHPLKRLFKQQRNLIKLELNALLIWKEHDIADCLSLMFDSEIIHTLQSLIVHNFVILPNKQQNATNQTSEIMMNESAQILGEFLIKCRLKTFKWYFEHINRTNTCYGIFVAFVMIYFKSSLVSDYSITDLHLPSFPHCAKSEELLLYKEIVSKLSLNSFHFRGDLRMIDWKTLNVKSPNLEYLRLDPMRSTTEQFTDCFVSCGQSLKTLSLDLASLAASGWYHQNDELTNFVIPYFRSKPLLKVERIELTVKFLEEESVNAFLSKAKYAKCLKSVIMNAQFCYFCQCFFCFCFFDDLMCGYLEVLTGI